MYLIGRLGIIPDERRQAMENKMFCFQCQETAGGNGCTFAGVCGKTEQALYEAEFAVKNPFSVTAVCRPVSGS